MTARQSLRQSEKKSQDIVRLCVNSSRESKTAMRVLQKAGFHVTRTATDKVNAPAARLNGRTYKGIEEIEKLAKAKSRVCG